MHRQRELTDQRYAMRYLYPAFIVLGAVLLLPLIFSAAASLMRWRLIPKDIRWLGLGNFIKLFGDNDVWHSIGLTLRFTVISVAFEMVAGYLVAAFLNIDFKGNKLVRVIVLLPMMLPPTIIALCWKLIMNYDRGVLNQVLAFIFGNGAKQVWLGKDWAFYSVLLVEVWISTPFVVLNVLAGLQAVSTDIIEASKIDGANIVQRAYYVVIPVIKPVLLVALIFRTTFSLRNFPIAYVLTGGGPANYTQFFALELYQEAFGKYHIGYASALSWLLIIVTFALSIGYTKITMRGESYCISCSCQSRARKIS